MNIKNWDKFTNGDRVIMNMFICKRGNPNWERCLKILNSIKFPTSVGISSSGYMGLGIQVLLDLDIQESIHFCENLLDKFLPEVPLIVISGVNVEIKNLPIGEWDDVDIVKPGRYFDKLISEGRTGLVVF